MAPKAYKLVILAVTVAACVGVAWWAGAFDHSGERDYRLELPPGSPSFDDIEPARIHSLEHIANRWPDEETLYALKPDVRDHRRKVYDPIALVRPSPDYAKSMRWDEHPRSRIRIVTNNLGMREDAPTLPEKTGVRILVGGDSHTFGFVENPESFPNLLEDELERHGSGPYEVINAGVTAAGPYECLGSLLKFVDLEPDLFVAVFYAGNDFLNGLPFADHVADRDPVRPARGFVRAIQLLREAGGTPTAQGFTQAAWLHHVPQTAQRSLAGALEAYLAMARACELRDITFQVVLLPSKPDVEPELAREQVDGLLARHGLSLHQFGASLRLGRRFAEELRARGVEVLDVTDGLREGDEELYWRKDHHLSVAGHRRMAELLAPVLRKRLTDG